MNASSEGKTPTAAASITAKSGTDELLTLDEAVQFLGTSKPTLYRWLAQGEVKGLKVGKQWRFRRSDLVAYVQRTPSAPTVPDSLLSEEKAVFDSELAKLGSNPDRTENAVERDGIATIAGQIFALAIRTRASDIHLEPVKLRGESFLLLRNRIDGVLHEVRRMPIALAEALTAQIKDQATMNVNERRLPQDGRMSLQLDGKSYELRASCIPALFGETLVIRILDKTDVLIGLDRLGLETEDLTKLRQWMAQPNGLIVAAGPIGAGKTTLLYSCLNEIARPEVRTLTIEDPVEYVIDFTTPIPVDKRAGMNFANALRSCMRHDPDIILIGEMRDKETADLVSEAVLTGHLLLTSINASCALEAIQWMRARGLQPFQIVAVQGVVAMRLVRKTCSACKEPADVAPSLRDYFSLLAAEDGFVLDENTPLYRGRGCAQCRNTGYRGRTGLYELLDFTPALVDAVLRGAPLEELAEVAKFNGLKTLLADGARKVAEGITTIDEVLRVTTAFL